MASRELKDLIPEMRERAEIVKQLCRKEGLDILIYCTYRSLEEQAELYCQGRTIRNIETAINALKHDGMIAMAKLLEETRTRPGKPIVTYAKPGQSWHNFGEAFDAVPMYNSKPIWNVFGKHRIMKEEWEIYGHAVRTAGLQWSGDWTKYREYVHAQYRCAKPQYYKEIREKLRN